MPIFRLPYSGCALCELDKQVSLLLPKVFTEALINKQNNVIIFFLNLYTSQAKGFCLLLFLKSDDLDILKGCSLSFKTMPILP